MFAWKLRSSLSSRSSFLRGIFVLTFVVPALFTASACKKPGQEGLPSADGGPSGSGKPRAFAAKPVTATDLKVVRCELGPVTSKARIETVLNAYGATRSLHAGPDGSLYFFPDHHPPTRLEPVAGGCGYRMAPPYVEKKGFTQGLEPDGSFGEYPEVDQTPKQKCRVRAFDKLRYGDGRRIGTRYVYWHDGAVMEMNLAADDCAPKELLLPDLENKNKAEVTVGDPSFGLSGEDLLISRGRSDWKHRKELFRFDPTNHLVRRLGSGEGKTLLEGTAHGCGDGYCIGIGSSLAIHNKDGERVAMLNLGEQTKLEGLGIYGVADIPEKGVYVLAGYFVSKGVGQGELVRVDGVR